MIEWSTLEARIDEQLRAAHVPGLALAVVLGREIIFARGFGITSVEDASLPITPQTLFRIGSTTKPLTGTAIMRLVDAGILDLDTPLSQYLDWFTLSEDHAAERVTLRMLLSHTAGLPTMYQVAGPRDPAALGAYLRQTLPTVPLVASPGTLWSYSNLGLNLAGYVAEVVTGTPFPQLMQEWVFEPLQMTRTTFDPLVAMTYPLAQSHVLGSDSAVCVGHRYADNTTMNPSGMACSTVLDLANFALMQLNQGQFQGQSFLPPASIAEMQRQQADPYVGLDAGYGLTFFIGRNQGRRQLWHHGSMSSFFARLTLLPDDSMAVIALYNRFTYDLDIDTIRNEIFDQVLGGAKPPPPDRRIEPDRTVWPAYVGTYLGHWQGYATIRIAKDQLVMDRNGERWVLEPWRTDLYVGKRADTEETITVGFITGAEPIEYIMVNTTPCRRVKQVAVGVVEPAQLQIFTGTYTGDVGSMIVHVSDGQLHIRPVWSSTATAYTPLDATRFVGREGIMTFQVAADGTVGALIWGGDYRLIRETNS
jgi:CubicO group peptidase (beta-lactamase class C family)